LEAEVALFLQHLSRFPLYCVPLQSGLDYTFYFLIDELTEWSVVSVQTAEGRSRRQKQKAEAEGRSRRLKAES
jgi:hypothetical protein